MDGYKIGNLTEESFEDINIRARELGFVEKSLVVSQECKKCTYGFLCRGGCRRHRDIYTDGELGKNYFCEAYRYFFDATLKRLQGIASALKLVYKKGHFF